MRANNVPPAPDPDDPQPPATPVARLFQGPECRGVLWPHDRKEPSHPGIAKISRHPGDAGSGQTAPTKRRCRERVELVDVTSLERKPTAQIVDPRILRRRPARMYDLAFVPGDEAPMALREAMPEELRLPVRPEACIVSVVGGRQKGDAYRYARRDLGQRGVQGALQDHNAPVDGVNHGPWFP